MKVVFIKRLMIIGVEDKYIAFKARRLLYSLEGE
ncbi:hypothetical protein M7I_6494 [Glarea lozoyensis 74030]|uniref:Uncharacterized protein n=1 Tax=Glarea lozoyensis (strain ATCC 74030 / MF5533) TaxID=1104152 RepID=H0EUQ5_GLAL7|nr:hypothetical protein M7I_6494 [Glarea lozoyensis 74030]